MLKPVSDRQKKVLSRIYIAIVLSIVNSTMRENQEETTHTSKAIYELEPCDKVAKLYVMQQKFDAPTFETME